MLWLSPGENVCFNCTSFSPLRHLAHCAACPVTVGLEYVTEIQVIGQSPRYHCELCDSKFDHNLKFPHLVGSKHRFNVLVSNKHLGYSETLPSHSFKWQMSQEFAAFLEK